MVSPNNMPLFMSTSKDSELYMASNHNKDQNHGEEQESKLLEDCNAFVVDQASTGFLTHHELVVELW